MNNHIEQNAARTIIDKGTRFRLSWRKTISIKPLKFGTVISICEELCNAGLTLQEIERGNDNQPGFLLKYADTMLRIIAIASLNDKKRLGRERFISNRIKLLKESLLEYQICELFISVINLSGMQAFMNTIRLAYTMKTMNLSPKASQGS